MEQQLEKRIRLLILQTYDAASEARIDVQRFFTGRLALLAMHHTSDAGASTGTSLPDAHERSDDYSSQAHGERTSHLVVHSQLVGIHRVRPLVLQANA